MGQSVMVENAMLEIATVDIAVEGADVGTCSRRCKKDDIGEDG